MEELLRLYREYCGHDAETVTCLGPSGSHRRYYRLTSDGRSVIGTTGTDADEDRAFITEARHFRSKGINVPEILSVSPDGMCYLQEDLGDSVLFDLVAPGREAGKYSVEEEELLCKAIAGLPGIQFKGAQGLDFDVCYPEMEFSGRMVDFDLNYFKYCFLKTSGVEFNESRLQDDFDRLREDLLRSSSDTFMYRDFQARNVMVRDGEPWYIDFQGGRRGPIYYDVASFIWQARSRFPADLKKKLIDAYLEALKPYRDISLETFMEKLRLFVLFRTLQVLGTYGFRGRFEKKAHFLRSIPFALENLRELLSEPFESYPYLTKVLTELSRERQGESKAEGPLEVTVISFSYRKGVPEDTSGNGGGYVFDCRGMHNPGRYEQYAHSTGRDADVRRFLEDRGEVFAFMDSIYELLDPHVKRYLSRSFEHLQVCFGCTGGQHRSVYCAEAAARHIKDTFGIKVHLIHREQGIDEIL